MNNIINQEGKDQIDALCNKYKIKNYTINGDGSIDVDGNVIFHNLGLTYFPIRINKVIGNFYYGNNKLTSLRGCPKTIDGDFFVFGNKLTSLKHCPTEIGGEFNCSGNKLTSLKWCPSKVGGEFDCGYNELSSLEGCSTTIGGKFYLHNNRFTKVFDDSFERLSEYERSIFAKYHSYYDIWTPEFNIDAMNDLIAEIKDGLL
jgi:hypothetical protein